MVSTKSFFSNLVMFPDMNHRKEIEKCHRRVTKIFFMKFWQRAAEIWDLKEGQNWDFSKSHISAALCQNFMKFFLVTLLWHILMSFLWFISGNLTKFEKQDMVKTLKIQNWPLLWPLSQKWLGFRTWTIISQISTGLILFTIPSLVDFQLNGAEI